MACSKQQPIVEDEIYGLVPTQKLNSNLADKKKELLSTLSIGVHSLLLSNARNAVIETIEAAARKTTQTRAPLRTQKLIKLPVTIVGDNVHMTEELMAKIGCIGLYPFYDDNLVGGRSNPELTSLLSGYLTIVCTYATQKSVEQSAIMKAFEHSGYEIEFKVKTEAEIDEKYVMVYDRLARAAKLKTFPESIKIILVISLSILLLMTKHLHIAARERWFQNRWRAISSMMRYVVSMESIAAPLLDNCNAVHTLFASMHRARNLVFQLMREIAHQGTTKYSAVFEAIIRTMWWAECIHIGMIDEHIMQNNKDVLMFAEFSGAEKTHLERAYEFLLGIPEENRPFVKILYDPDFTSILNQRNFRTLYTAARAIASLESKSIEQIETARKEESAPLFKKVADYIRNKRSISALNAAESAGAELNPLARLRLTQIVNSADNTGTETTTKLFPARL